MHTKDSCILNACWVLCFNNLGRNLFTTAVEKLNLVTSHNSCYIVPCIH